MFPLSYWLQLVVVVMVSLALFVIFVFTDRARGRKMIYMGCLAIVGVYLAAFCVGLDRQPTTTTAENMPGWTVQSDTVVGGLQVVAVQANGKWGEYQESVKGVMTSKHQLVRTNSEFFHGDTIQYACGRSVDDTSIQVPCWELKATVAYYASNYVPLWALVLLYSFPALMAIIAIIIIARTSRNHQEA